MHYSIPETVSLFQEHKKCLNKRSIDAIYPRRENKIKKCNLNYLKFFGNQVIVFL